jgi:hypothetical protein
MDTFERDTTHQALFECGKRLGAAFNAFLFLLAFSFLVTFSIAGEGEINIPFLNLKLERIYAASALIGLMSIAYFRYECYSYYERILRMKMYESLEGIDKSFYKSIWFLDYPTIDKFLSLSHKFSSPISIVGAIVQTIFILAFFIAPITLLIKLGVDTSFASLWWATSAITLGFFISGVVIHNNHPSWESVMEVISNIDKRKNN